MPKNKTEEQKHTIVRVQMYINDSESTMLSGYTKENLPEPNDPGVGIKNTADEYVAAIRFGGYASDQDLKFYSEIMSHNK